MFQTSWVGALALASLAVLTVCNFAAADTLIDGLSVPAHRAATLGKWSLKPARARPSDPWKASVTTVVAADPAASMTLVSASAAQQPYGLRGPLMEGTGRWLRGFASYYDESTGLTAAGEHFDPKAMTAAHPTLPFGTKVRVTRLDTGGSVVVRINDRGPFKKGRVIDLTEGAAENLGMTNAGLTEVRLDVLDR